MSSIQEVAKRAGVSTATVSRTFSTPNLLSEETRERVLKVADRMNYRPRRRTVKPVVDMPRTSEVSDCLGFLFFASDADANQINEFYASVLVGAQDQAAQLGMHLIVRTLPRYQTPAEMPRMSLERAVGGVLLVGAAPPHVVQAFAGGLPPSVLVDNCIPDCGLDCVISDGLGGSYAATHHLIELGHRRIGFLMNDPDAPSFRDRLRGYLCAHYDTGLTPDPNNILVAQSDGAMASTLKGMLQRDNRPSAIVAANDINAFVLMQACRDFGLAVPTDISIIGFDNMPFSVHSYPPLTTVGIDKQYLGHLAVRQLHRRIQESADETGRREPPVQITVPVSLITRGTCRNLNHH